MNKISINSNVVSTCQVHSFSCNTLSIIINAIDEEKAKGMDVVEVLVGDDHYTDLMNMAYVLTCLFSFIGSSTSTYTAPDKLPPIDRVCGVPLRHVYLHSGLQIVSLKPIKK